MNFTITAPPSLNTIYRVGKGGRVYKTKECKDWMADAHYEVMDQTGKWQTEYRAVAVTVIVYPKDGRLRDLDNYLKPLLDFLEESRMIDNDRQVVVLHLERREPTYDRHLLSVDIQAHISD